MIYKDDTVTLAKIQTAHPLVKAELALIYKEIKAALTGKSSVRFTFVYRTWAEQDYIYNLGRTIKNPDGYDPIKKPLGNIVTNAKAGQSIHNYGFAVDIAILVDANGDGNFEKVSWDMEIDLDGDHLKDWMEIVNIFISHGWSWGGDWPGKFKDYPHFDKSFGHTWRDLLALHNAGKVDKQGYVII